MARSQTKTGGREATTGVIPGRYGLSVGNPKSPVPDGWSWTPLVEVTRLETGHTPSRKKPEYWDGDIPWIGIKDARHHHGRDIHTTTQNASQLGIDNSAARVLPRGTVCLSRTASIGYITRTAVPMATSQDFVNWVCGPGLDSRFLTYVLLSEVESLFRFAHGSTHQTIYFPEVKAFHVKLPPLPEQRRIAAVLGALDDKIELNRKMNRTLEEMAQALFKSWFIDFDGHDDLVDSELGPIPRGWRVSRWNELARLAYGKGLKGYKDAEGLVEVFGTNGPIGKTSKALWDEPTVVVGRKGAYRGVHLASGPSWVIDTAFYLQPTDRIDIRWAYYAISQYDLNSMDSGSAIPSTSREAFYALRVALAPIDRQQSFHRVCRPFWRRQESNLAESRILAELRDTLLPKLVSGELRVPEVEAKVEAAL